MSDRSKFTPGSDANLVTAMLGRIADQYPVATERLAQLSYIRDHLDGRIAMASEQAIKDLRQEYTGEHAQFSVRLHGCEFFVRYPDRAFVLTKNEEYRSLHFRLRSLGKTLRRASLKGEEGGVKVLHDRAVVTVDFGDVPPVDMDVMLADEYEEDQQG